MADSADKALAKAAIDKLKAGQTPSAREAGALKRIERERDEQQRWEHYRSVPARHYKEMSGRPARVLIDQAQRLGIPCAGRVVDLTAVLRWMHDHLAKEAHRPDPASDSSRSSRALERLRTAQARLKEIELGREAGQLLHRASVEDMIRTSCMRLIACLNLVETAIATEFGIWLHDPKVAQMDELGRRAMVRAFVADTCRAVRAQEATAVRELIERDRMRLREEKSEAGGESGEGSAPAPTGERTDSEEQELDPQSGPELESEDLEPSP